MQIVTIASFIASYDCQVQFGFSQAHSKNIGLG